MTLNTAALSVSQQVDAALAALPSSGRNASGPAVRDPAVAKTP